MPKMICVNMRIIRRVSLLVGHKDLAEIFIIMTCKASPRGSGPSGWQPLMAGISAFINGSND